MKIALCYNWVILTLNLGMDQFRYGMRSVSLPCPHKRGVKNSSSKKEEFL
jgi:hypothetical protein